jgi:hypothetical protein
MQESANASGAFLREGNVEEKEMREAKVPTFVTLAEVSAYIDELVTQEHGYGTCVYAMSMAAVAAYNYVASKLEVTGFQASCADLDIVRRNRRLEHGFRLVDYQDLLYPQYCDSEHFPGYKELLEELKKELGEAAAKLLEETPCANPDVLKHWAMLAERAKEGGE